MSLLDSVLDFLIAGRKAARERSMADQHPEFLDRLHVLTVRSDAEQGAGTVDASYAAGMGDYAGHIWVNKAVRVWADSLAPLRVGVADERGALSFSHPAALLLADPNPDLTGGDLWRRWAVDMALGGECGLELRRSQTNAAGAGGSGRQWELYPKQPSDFAVRPAKGRRGMLKVAAYVVNPDTEDAYTVRPEEFKHFKFYNPANPWRGLAPLAAVRLGVVIDQLVQAWTRVFFSNGARPDFAVIAPEGLTPSERQEIEFRLAAEHGAGQWHRPIVLEKGVQDIKVFSFPRKDLEWLDQRRMSRDEIGAVFGVPDEIMGYGRDTYENFDTAERVLWALTLSNLINFRDEQLTHFFLLADILKPGQRLVTDLSRVWALRRAAAQQMKDAHALFAMGVPFNTIDKVLGLGVGPVAGGDRGYPRAAKWGDAKEKPPRKDPTNKSTEKERELGNSVTGGNGNG